jgi:hypothetical protein
MLRDARALTPRVMLQMFAGERRVAVFAGFRGESLSLYFADDPVYHFNARRELRRAFVDGQLIKAERGQLVALERRQTVDTTSLVGGTMEDEAKQRLVDDMMRRLVELRSALQEARFNVEGQEPAGGRAVERLGAWLASNLDARIADSPRLD